MVLPVQHLEAIAFNPEHQYQNPILKEVVPRIIALVAPILYLCQIAFMTILGAIYCMCGGMALQTSLVAVFESIPNLFSSIVEIPQKMVTGPNNAPNYFGTEDRYSMKEFHVALI